MGFFKDLGQGLSSALGGGIFNIIGGAMNNHAQIGMNRENFNNAVRMFDMTNAYNTPANQRQRLEDAGLNPALMYGGGSVSNVSAPARAPEGKAPESGAPFLAMGQMFENFMRYALLDKQIQLAEVSAAQKSQAIVASQKDVQLKDYLISTKYPTELKDVVARTSARMFETDKSREFMPYQLEALKLGNERSIADTALIKERVVGEALSNVKKGIENLYLSREKEAALELSASTVLTNLYERKVKQGVITRQDIENTVSETFKDMARKGVLKSDPLPARMLGLFIDMIDKNVKSYFGKNEK